MKRPVADALTNLFNSRGYKTCKFSLAVYKGKNTNANDSNPKSIYILVGSGLQDHITQRGLE
jgi:hypothetical protein